MRLNPPLQNDGLGGPKYDCKWAKFQENPKWVETRLQDSTQTVRRAKLYKIMS